MIQFAKPAEVPVSLTSRGKAATDRICESYETGERQFNFDAAIFAAHDVKQALIESQHGKCSFCERKVYDDGDVEHFRPKSAVKQAAGSRLLRPGYYWLAYEWQNLLLACPQCNSRAKGSLFPLIDEAARVRHHSKAHLLPLEKPLFVNPTREDPADFIEFRDEVPIAINENIRGETTIRQLGLTRPALNILRFQRLLQLRQYYEGLTIAEESPDIPELQRAAVIWKQLLDESVLDSAEFAAMVRCAAARNFRSVSDN